VRRDAIRSLGAQLVSLLDPESVLLVDHDHAQVVELHRVLHDNRAVIFEITDSYVESGGKPEINDTKTYNNKVKIVPSYLLKPVVVDISNWKSVLVDSGYYKLDQLQ